MIEKNIDKKLANRISYQIRYKRCSKGKFGEFKPTKEGPYPPADMDWEGGSKYTVTPAQNVRDFW